MFIIYIFDWWKIVLYLGHIFKNNIWYFKRYTILYIFIELYWPFTFIIVILNTKKKRFKNIGGPIVLWENNIISTTGDHMPYINNWRRRTSVDWVYGGSKTSAIPSGAHNFPPPAPSLYPGRYSRPIHIRWQHLLKTQHCRYKDNFNYSIFLARLSYFE